MDVIYTRWRGPHSDARIRREFERLDRLARRAGVPTGRWIFLEPGDRRWEVCLELRGRSRPPPGTRRRTLRPVTIAYFRINPDKEDIEEVWKRVTARLTELRRKGRITKTGVYREVYTDNPWTRPEAWARTESQIVVYPRRR